MANPNSLNLLKNVNLSSAKERAKKTAALTLLLSTTSCTSGEIVANVCWTLPVIYLVGIGFAELHRRYHYNHPPKTEKTDNTNPPHWY